MEKTVKDIDALSVEATEFVRALVPKPDQATLVTLSGDLGAGKTAFVKAVAQALGIEGVVTSPTFVLEKIYQIPVPANFSKLIHIDAYRLEKGTELATLRFNEVMKDPGNLVMLEWPERATGELPPSDATITLVARPDGSRSLAYG